MPRDEIITCMTAELSLSPEGAAPEWIQVFPSGTFTARDGRGPYSISDPEALIARTHDFWNGWDIPLDYNHQTARDAGQAAPAAGWIKELQPREDGIWARVEWTPRGRDAVVAREYRYISPYFTAPKKEVGELLSVAVTNLPALVNMTPLSFAMIERHQTLKEHTMDFKETMAQTLGLSLAAGEGEIIAAAASLRDDLSRAKTSLAAGPDPARYVPKDMHDAIATELASLKADVARARSGELVKSAQSAGKLTPAMEQWGLSYATADPEGFKAWMAAAPVLAPASKDALAQAAPPRDSGTHAALSPEEKAVCAACGISEDKYRQAGREVPHGQTH